MLKVEREFVSTARRCLADVNADAAPSAIDDDFAADALALLACVHVDSDGVEHEVRARGHRAVWCAGGVLQRAFTAPSPVRQVLWARFGDVAEWPRQQPTDNNNNNNNAQVNRSSGVAAMPLDLCVVHRDGVLVHTAHGSLYSLVLPCAMRRLWVLPLGVYAENCCFFLSCFCCFLICYL
jgi:hypothetical protein